MKNCHKNILGLNIKKARKDLKISEEFIANNLKCSQQMISEIERGNTFGKIFIEYVLLLKKNGVDMNKIFDVG